MDRLHNLEHLIKELRGQLENAQAGTAPTDPDRHSASVLESDGPERYSAREVESSPREDHSDSHSPFGRLVLQDGASDSHYVGNGFWSRIVDEVSRLRGSTLPRLLFP